MQQETLRHHSTKKVYIISLLLIKRQVRRNSVTRQFKLFIECRLSGNSDRERRDWHRTGSVFQGQSDFLAIKQCNDWWVNDIFANTNTKSCLTLLSFFFHICSLPFLFPSYTLCCLSCYTSSPWIVVKDCTQHTIEGDAFLIPPITFTVSSSNDCCSDGWKSPHEWWLVKSPKKDNLM